MEVFGTNNFRTPLAATTVSAWPCDEVDRLTATFARMASLIDEQVNRLKRKDELRRDLVANISHDLRTPLASLQGHLETLQIKNGALGEVERSQYIETATRQSRQLARRIGELFELAKLEAQENLLQCEPFSLAELVQDVVLKFGIEAGRKQVAIFADKEPDLPFVDADIGLIERALDNLLNNALHYTPGGGQIRLVLAVQNGRLCLYVSDTGPGIAAEARPYIFDRFYSNQNGAQDHHDGAGLGLAITKRIVDLHGGTIEACSQPNHGARFTICLPLAVPE